MIPDKSDFTRKEWQIISNHRTPAQVQRMLRAIPYNNDDDKPTCRSFRGVVQANAAHCLEGAIAAATILEQHGYPPLLVSIESQDSLDHVLFVFQKNELWGAVARSRDLGLHGRKPVFRNIRELVRSYYETYIDKSGRITGYALTSLHEIGDYDWRLSLRNVWKVERHLQQVPHKKLRSSDARYRLWHRRYIEFRQRCPNRYPDYYPDRHLWQL